MLIVLYSDDDVIFTVSTLKFDDWIIVLSNLEYVFDVTNVYDYLDFQ